MGNLRRKRCAATLEFADGAQGGGVQWADHL